MDELESHIKDIKALAHLTESPYQKEHYKNALECLCDAFRGLTLEAEEKRDAIDEMCCIERDTMEKATREAYDLEYQRLDHLAKRSVSCELA
jgi:hypothetical protein